MRNEAHHFIKAKSKHGNNITQTGRSQRSILSHFLNKGREQRFKLEVVLKAFMAKCSLPTCFSLPWMRFCRLSWLTATACKDRYCTSMYASFTAFTPNSSLRKIKPSWASQIISISNLYIQTYQSLPNVTFWLRFQKHGEAVFLAEFQLPIIRKKEIEKACHSL